jgi:hypothetical protein
MRTLLLSLVLAAFLIPVCDQASADPVLDSGIQMLQDKIHGYYKTAHILEAVSALVILIGLAVGAAQAGDFPVKKFIVAGLGVLSAAIVGLTPVFSRAPYRAYENVANHMQAMLANFTWKMKQYTPLTDQMTKELRSQFTDLLQQVQTMEDVQINNNLPPAAARTAVRGFSFLPEAWAQQPSASAAALPLWVKEVPVDNNIYYLGTGDGTTFNEAHDKALASARSGATSAWVQAASGPQLVGKTALIDQLAKALGEAAEPSQSYVAPVPGGGFRGYVLLRLSRTAAAFSVQAVFSEARVPPDEKLLDAIRGGGK